jgi:hypothetical protein
VVIVLIKDFSMPNQDVQLAAEDKLVIDVKTQTMRVSLKNGFSKTYNVSTAERGIGNASGSYQTPLGRHKVCAKIGAFAPLYTIFKSRENTETICETINAPITDDLILTRILRLSGEEPGVNSGTNEDGTCVDSYERYIYIHGTNREDLLGTPASKGCIRMANADIAELFLMIRQDTAVEIHADVTTAPKLTLA